jgi:alkylated DNA repair dioxygenase AlkB
VRPDFVATGQLPPGFKYRPDLLDAEQEHSLLEQIRSLPFRDFEFHGFVGKRRVVSYGWRYDFNGGGLSKTEDIPGFLMGVRDLAAAFADIPVPDLQQVLVTEYGPGAAIGWHSDRAVFGDVVGISLLAPCTFRLRRRREKGWDRASVELEPRSVYLLRGPSRTDWEHSIPPVAGLRYSLTFRSVLGAGS